MHQRLALGLFVVIGLATFALGAMRVTNTIFDPLRLKGGGTEFKTAEQVERERNDKLRVQDTDKDGLNDYDELYVFRTSPFLEDTDSDGDLDGKEVADESDPNCPKGRVCRAVRVATTAPVVSETTPNGTSTTAPVKNTTSISSGGTSVAGNAPPQAASPEQISAAITETFGDPNTLTTKQVADGIAKMSSVELRAFLIKLGVPQKVLDKTDDTTLRKLLSDSLNEMTK